MNILLIDPVTTAKTLSVAERQKLRRGIGYPGLGLPTVAALTPSRFHVRLIDESVEVIDFNAKPDLVGISVQAPTAPYAYELCSIFRSRGIKVVLGGIHTSLNPEEAAANADAVVIGEAETTWPDLLRDFEEGKLQRRYCAGVLADLDTSPRPRRDLLRKENYQIPGVVQASKGCPFGCEFCSLHAHVGHQPRFRAVESVVSEIRDLARDQILFADDNIYINRAFTKNLFQALYPLRKRWVAESTWHIAYDEEILSLARESGCAGLFIGFDSINRQPMMTKIPAAGNIEEIYIKAIQNIHKKGIAVVAAFVFGLDNDDDSVFERSLNVALKGGANLVNFSVLVPYPGTPIFHRLRKENRITEWNWSRYISPNVCFEPKRMTGKQLYEGVLWPKKSSILWVISSVSRSMRSDDWDGRWACCH